LPTTASYGQHIFSLADNSSMTSSWQEALSKLVAKALSTKDGIGKKSFVS
jgi:hypothetical protein